MSSQFELAFLEVKKLFLRFLNEGVWGQFRLCLVPQKFKIKLKYGGKVEGKKSKVVRIYKLFLFVPLNLYIYFYS